ncbi:MAG: hypothetical protein OXC07_09560 [Kistimonas sp.]|nr:hypothetical protein [Kistimonas sp.]
MQGSEVFAKPSGGATANWPEERSNSVPGVEYRTHGVQQQEPLTVATRLPEGGSGSSGQLASVARSLQQRAIEPKNYKVDLGSADLPINYPSPGWKLPQEDIPHPECEPDLDDDMALGDRFQKPESMDFIRSQLAERRRAIEEDNAGSFTFAPLMTTLSNIKKFVCHIGSGRHFGCDHPLTDSDRTALDWLQERADVLLQEKAPYELTVHLAFAFLAVHEAMLSKRVTAPRDPDRGLRWNYELVDVAPHEITAYRWGGNNTTGLKSGEEFYNRHCVFYLRDALTLLLRDPNMLLYPSFQPLGIEDFCGFGHMPVHPIGMITGYACNADGYMYGPLKFAIHDVVHTNGLRHVAMFECGARAWARELLPADAMRSSDHRLILRQMLLDSSCPAELKPGLRILQFHLLHEKGPDAAARVLENNNYVFPRCLEILLDTLRELRAGYHPDDVNITDSNAVMAALWGARFLCQWRAAGFKPLSQQQLELCAATFATQDLPLLRQHLAFLADHRGSLRQMFIGGYGHCLADTQGHYQSVTLFARASDLLSRYRMTLFASFDSGSGLCHVDNIDLAYFAALTSSAMRSGMEQCTGARLPAGIVLASEDSPS